MIPAWSAARRGLWLASLALLAALSSGCTYVGIALAGALSGSSSGSSEGAATVAPPALGSVSPSEGSHLGGQLVTVRGRGFLPECVVRFGNLPATEVELTGPETLRCRVPASASAGAVDVLVSNPLGGSDTLVGGFRYTNEAPQVELFALAGEQSGNVVVRFRLSDAESDLLDLRLEVDLGDGFRAIEPGHVVSGSLEGLGSSPSGVLHSVTWDSQRVLLQRDANAARFRLTATDRSDGGEAPAVVGEPFRVHNNAAADLELARPNRDAYRVALRYRVTNAEAQDTVRVTSLRWVDEQTGATGPLRVVSGQGLGSVAAAPTGSWATTVWDSLSDLGYGNNRLVRFEVTIDDGYTALTRRSEAFVLDNGPLADPSTLSINESPYAIAAGDVLGDARPDVLLANEDTLSFLVGQGRTVGAPQDATPPLIPQTTPPFPDPAPNDLLRRGPHLSLITTLDVDGDGDEDVIAGDSAGSPTTLSPYYTDPASALGEAAADAGAGFVHVIAHQATLVAPRVGGAPDVAGGRWESAQAAITSRAPHHFVAGASEVPATASGNPSLDHVGWFLQRLLSEDLDGPGAPGAGSRDLVLLHGVSQLGRALSGDLRGAVVLRQVDPTSDELGPPIHLDPTHMGSVPIACAVGDVLSSTRTSAPLLALGASAPLGAKDIVVANAGDNSLTFYVQLDSASWPAPAAPRFTSVKVAVPSLSGASVPAGDVAGVVVGDLNGDQRNDLVVIAQAQQRAIVYLGDPDPAASGSLLPQTHSLIPLRQAGAIPLSGSSAAQPTLADFNGDGHLDLALPFLLTQQVHLLLNRGEGLAFDPLILNLSLAASAGVAAGDLDGDERADLLLASLAQAQLCLQVSPGTLDESPLLVEGGQGPLFLSQGDLLGEGRPQLVAATNGNELLVYRTGSSEGAPLSVAQRTSTAEVGGVRTSGPRLGALADLDGDGRLDLTSLVSNVIEGGSFKGGFVTFPSAGAARVVTSSMTGLVAGFCVGDVDRDGRLDVVYGGVGASQVVLLLRQASGDYSELSFSGLSSVQGVHLVDLDGDGWLDMVASALGGGGSETAIYFNGGHPAGSLAYGTLPATPVRISAPGTWQNVASGDFDGDGRRDLVATDLVTNQAFLHFQTGARSFTNHSLPTGSQPSQVAVGDIDGDGRLDLAIPWGADNRVAIYRRRASFSTLSEVFDPPQTYSTSANPTGAAILDVDGDTRADLVVSATAANSLNVFLQR